MKLIISLFSALLLSASLLAADAPPAAARSAAAAQTRAAAVAVAVTLQELPGGNPIVPFLRGERCPNCGRYHSSDYSGFTGLERPALATGFLVAPDAVLCHDDLIPDENIVSIEIRKGAESVPARIERVYLDHAALLLRLERPLADAKPLAIDSGAGDPALVAAPDIGPLAASGTAQRLRAKVSSYEPPVPEAVWDDGAPVPTGLPTHGAALFDAEGRFAGFAYGDGPAAAGRDPAAWRSISRAEFAALLDDAKKATETFTRPVRLTFRSAQKDSRQRRRYRDDDDDLTELKTIGRFAAKGRLLVDLQANDTDAEPAIPRLDKILVTLADGTEAEASFVCVLRTARFLVAELPESIPTPLPEPYPGEPADYADGLLLHTAVIPVGAGKTTVYATAVRTLDIEIGWRGTACADGPFQITASDAILTPDGKVIWQGATVLEKKDSAGKSNRWSHDDDNLLLPAAVFAAFADPAEADISPVRPVPKEEEGVYGWIGLELQPVDEDLADAMDIVKETENGEFGAIVSRVHEGSTAEAAGVQPDWVLLTIRPVGELVSRKVTIDDADGYGGEFPWERLGEVPPQYLDRIPTPWSSVADDFTDELRKIGIGAKIEAEFLVDGEKVVKEIVIEKGPAHYGNAPSFKWEAAGITVCDLTFEVREYLTLAADAPGVVVKRIESGAKAAVAGLRPFEVVTSVNGTPIRDVKGFEAAVTEGDPTDFRMEVLRMDKTRVVQFTK